MIEVRLPLPPSVNSLYRETTKAERARAAKLGRKLPGRLKTHRYETWLNAAGWELKAQRPKSTTGDYVLWLYCERPDKRRRDLANLVKALEDLLVAHGVVEDDSKCTELHVYWHGEGRECTVKAEPAISVATRKAA